MVQDNTLLLNVARNLRYIAVESMVGKTVTISDRTLITTETAAFMDQFVDGCSFAGPEQKYLDGQIAKYGILDLRFDAPTTMLDAPTTMLDVDAKTGIPLLRHLGFVDNDAQGLVDEQDDDTDYCLEELRDDIAQCKTYLMLFLKAAMPNASAMPISDRMARLRDPSSIPFPISFFVVDACVANTSFVWMHKHLYLWH